MTKKNKTLLTITAIISFVIAGLFIIAIALYLFDAWNIKAVVRDFFMKAMELQDETDLNFQITMTITDCFVGAFLNMYAGVTYLRYSKTQNIIIGGYKIVIYTGVLQLLFVISLVPGIMAIIVGNTLKNGENRAVTTQVKPQSSMDILTEKINFIKQQKEAGTITEEQYNNMLNKYIEEEANNKNKNSH